MRRLRNAQSASGFLSGFQSLTGITARSLGMTLTICRKVEQGPLFLPQTQRKHAESQLQKLPKNPVEFVVALVSPFQFMVLPFSWDWVAAILLLDPIFFFLVRSVVNIIFFIKISRIITSDIGNGVTKMLATTGQTLFQERR